jgi:hypothetical protein
MQKLGQKSEEGFSLADLQRAESWFAARGVSTELISLHERLPEGVRAAFGGPAAGGPAAGGAQGGEAGGEGEGKGEGEGEEKQPAKRRRVTRSKGKGKDDGKDLGLEAYVLVARGGLAALLGREEKQGEGEEEKKGEGVAEGGGGSGAPRTADAFFAEQAGLAHDKKAFMKGRVVNKKARHNLCFQEHAQEPDYENGKGRVVAFASVPLLGACRDGIGRMLGSRGERLEVEGEST